MAWRFTNVEPTFTALISGNLCARAFFGTKRWSLFTYQKVKPDITRPLFSVSRGRIGESFLLQLFNEQALKNFYELNDCYNPYMALSFSEKKKRAQQEARAQLQAHISVISTARMVK